MCVDLYRLLLNILNTHAGGNTMPVLQKTQNTDINRNKLISKARASDKKRRLLGKLRGNLLEITDLLSIDEVLLQLAVPGVSLGVRGAPARSRPRSPPTLILMRRMW